jgi:tripartite-type tricarboxylate transporter receptor subunit TctC
MPMSSARRCAWLLGALVCAPVQGHAQRTEYPSRPIRVIVPFVAGGGTDLLARLVSPKLSELLGQQIVIDNRGGAASIVGTQIVAKAVPDGYTLGIFDTAFAINPAFADKLPYDAMKDFAFIAIIATSPSLLIANPKLKARTIQDLIAAAKASPGKIRFASAGVGSASHLSSEMLKSAAKISFVHVPFKGAGAAVIDVLGGHTDLTFVVPGTVKQHLQAGTLVGLAITGNRPSVNAPDVPTFASVGLGSVNPGSFRFMAAPAGVAPAIQNKLIASLANVMKAPELQEQLAANDFDPTTFLPHPEARGYVDKEIRKWVQAVKDSGAKP